MVLTLPLSTLRKGSANNSTFALPPTEVEIEVERGGVAHAVCYWYRVTMVDPGSAFLSDSVISSAMKTQKCDIKNNHQNLYKNLDENVFKNENEKESNNMLLLNEMFPYTLDTGPYGLEKCNKDRGNLTGKSEGKRAEADSDKYERKQGREKKREEKDDNEEDMKEEKNIDAESKHDTSSSSSSSFPTSSSSTSSSSSLPSYSGLPKHYRQAATLLDDAVIVSADDTILVEVGIDICYGVLCRVISHFT